MPRPRLDRRLSEWAPVTVLRGLHGYGKTTQLAVWLASQSSDDVRCVWVTTRPVSDGAPTFEECLHRRLRVSGIVVPETSTGRVATNGLDELDAALCDTPHDRRFVLAADDVQHLRDERVIAELLGLVKRHPHFHLYACCPGRHPVESLAGGTVDVNAVEPRELLADDDEIERLASIMGRHLDRRRAQELRDAVGASISAIRMALRAGDTSGPRALDVAEYLRTRVLPEVAEQGLLEPLMRFSLAHAIEGRMVRDLCDDADPDRLLEALEGTGIVERVAGAQELRLAIPAPFRDILRNEYASTAPRAARAFHGRLAEWFAHHDVPNHVSFSFAHAVAAEDWALMDELWFDNVAALFLDQPDLVRETLEMLPAPVLASRPSMQVVRDTLRIASYTGAGASQRTLHAFADASARVVRQHWDTMSANELLVVATGYLIHLRLSGRFQDSAAVGDRVHARSGARAATQRVSTSRLAWFHLHRGITYSLLHDDASAVRSYVRAEEHAASPADDLVRSCAAANLALTDALAGNAERALQSLQRHRTFATRRRPGDEAARIGGHLAAGFLALDRLDLAGVRAALDALGDGAASWEFWPFIAFLCAQHALHTGLTVEALAHLDQVQAAHDDELADKGAAAALMTRARADLLIACGRGESATRLLAARGGDMPLTRVPAARMRLLARGTDASAEICPSTWDASTSARDRIELLLLGAIASLRADDPRNTQRLVNQALNVYADTGVLRPFATVPNANLARILAVADRDLAPDDAARLREHEAVYPERVVLIELSDREQSVLLALAEHASRQAIADSLFVSINTVKTQLASIYQKLGCTTRQEALAAARRLDLLPR